MNKIFAFKQRYFKKKTSKGRKSEEACDSKITTTSNEPENKCVEMVDIELYNRQKKMCERFEMQLSAVLEKSMTRIMNATKIRKRLISINKSLKVNVERLKLKYKMLEDDQNELLKRYQQSEKSRLQLLVLLKESEEIRLSQKSQNLHEYVEMQSTINTLQDALQRKSESMGDSYETF